MQIVHSRLVFDWTVWRCCAVAAHGQLDVGWVSGVMVRAGQLAGHVSWHVMRPGLVLQQQWSGNSGYITPWTTKQRQTGVTTPVEQSVDVHYRLNTVTTPPMRSLMQCGPQRLFESVCSYISCIDPVWLCPYWSATEKARGGSARVEVQKRGQARRHN